MLLTGSLLVLSKSRFPFGNNRLSKKSALGISWVVLILCSVAVVLLVNRIQFPIGDIATLPFILAGLILVEILLIGQLVFMVAPSRLLSNLQDLRNDIIFLRVNIDEGLRRYETLSEGQTLPDALKKELSEIVNDLNLIEYAHSNMGALIEKLLRELPRQNDPMETKDQKAKQFVLDKDSYFLHDAKCKEVSNALQTKINNLVKQLTRLGAVTEDRASENTIRTLLTQRLQRIQAVENELTRRIQQIIYFANNPDKIPPELSSETSQTSEWQSTSDSIEKEEGR